MNLGQNLQYLRRLHRHMTQEALAEQMNVTRQTISKWELDQGTPEISKLKELSDFFKLSMEELLFERLDQSGDHLSEIELVTLEAFTYISYPVVSPNPEDDAILHAKTMGLNDPLIIGWDFPVVSQEQINLYHMHGYVAAIVIPEDATLDLQGHKVMRRVKGDYVMVTVKEPFDAPFRLIPSAYKAIFRYIEINRFPPVQNHEDFCFEKVLSKDGVEVMEIYVAIGH